MNLSARPIVFTSDISGWRRLLDALGGQAVVDLPGWIVYAVGSGRVALHDAEHSDHAPGHVLLGFETDNLSAWSAATSVAHTIEETDHGTAATVRAADGLWFWVDTLAAPGAPAPDDTNVSVLPIWYTADTGSARQTLTDVGLQERVTSDTGGWADFSCPTGGLTAVHATDGTSTELAFEFSGDVETLLQPLAQARIDGTLIDETYSRTVRVPNPDGGDPIFINEQQTDLYGFSTAAGKLTVPTQS